MVIAKVARRLGLRPSVPASLVDSWAAAPTGSKTIELAPRSGVASCLVDETGRIQPANASWSLDWTLAAGARWLTVGESGRITQRLQGPAVIETAVETPAGTVIQRVGAAVVGGKPVAIIEIENAGGVAIAVGLVARPLTHAGRGYVGTASVDSDMIRIDDQVALRYATPPAATKAIPGAQGDLLRAMPAATGGAPAASARCRSGGAQTAAVWPLPHTATLRVVLELDGQTPPGAAVPTLAEVNRGWQTHLNQGIRVDVDELDVATGLAACGRTLLAGWSRPPESPSVITALAELGFGADAVRSFGALERVDDDLRVLSSVARWFQLADHPERFEHLEAILGVTAKAAHVLDANKAPFPGPAWLGCALDALSRGLRVIDQTEVGERIATFETSVSEQTAPTAAFEGLTRTRDERWIWEGGQLDAAARYVSGARGIVVDDRGADLRLLPDIPLSWRGRTIDVLAAPVTGGRVSFGLRWHGSRPALLWEAEVDQDIDLKLSAPGLDPSFSTGDRAGETLLADPGWDH